MIHFIKKKYLYAAAAVFALCLGLTACGEKEDNTSKIDLADGTYTAEFTTDSSMFHVNEAYDNKGTLTVKDGQATIHVTLQSKKILNLFPGTAEDAQRDGAQLLEPTTDTVDYGDGDIDEAYGFDVPVPALDEEFDLALIGNKGVWYDHKVKVSNPQPYEESETTASAETTEAAADASEAEATTEAASAEALSDGTYMISLDFEGGSGKASIISPAKVTITNGEAIATVEWSSPNYDYMIVNGEKYLPVNTEGNSVFEIPVVLDEPVDVIGDTVAMSKPHEIEYTLTFHSETATAE